MNWSRQRSLTGVPSSDWEPDAGLPSVGSSGSAIAITCTSLVVGRECACSYGPISSGRLEAQWINALGESSRSGTEIADQQDERNQD